MSQRSLYKHLRGDRVEILHSGELNFYEYERLTKKLKKHYRQRAKRNNYPKIWQSVE